MLPDPHSMSDQQFDAACDRLTGSGSRSMATCKGTPSAVRRAPDSSGLWRLTVCGCTFQLPPSYGLSWGPSSLTTKALMLSDSCRTTHSQHTGLHCHRFNVVRHHQFHNVHFTPLARGRHDCRICTVSHWGGWGGNSRQQVQCWWLLFVVNGRLSEPLGKS